MIELMNIIGKKYNISTAQTAVVYCLTKGIVPLCGCRKPYHIEQLIQNVSIRFTPEETTALVDAADKCGVKIMKADIFRFMSK